MLGLEKRFPLPPGSLSSFTKEGARDIKCKEREREDCSSSFAHRSYLHHPSSQLPFPEQVLLLNFSGPDSPSGPSAATMWPLLWWLMWQPQLGSAFSSEVCVPAPQTSLPQSPDSDNPNLSPSALLPREVATSCCYYLLPQSSLLTFPGLQDLLNQCLIVNSLC